VSVIYRRSDYVMSRSVKLNNVEASVCGPISNTVLAVSCIRFNQCSTRFSSWS
jgi:hypothetical protein